MSLTDVHEWGNSIVGKPLRSAYGLIHTLDIEDIEHPQQLQLIFEGGGNGTISCASNGSALVLRDVAMVESDLGEYGKQIIKDLSGWHVFSGLINKELLSLSAIHSKTEEGVIGLAFYFNAYGNINIINLGDEINVYKHIPEDIQHEEDISFIEVIAK